MGDRMDDKTDDKMDVSMGDKSDQSHQQDQGVPEPMLVDHHAVDTLFENYQPRSLSTIIAQQRAIKDSQAAEAAAVILEGVEIPEYDTLGIPGHIGLLEQINDESFGPIRTQRRSPLNSALDQLLAPGAQFVYALIIITLLGGLIGLAASIESPMLVLIAGIASPILLPICVWKWIRWLDSTPYYYRLLTSLGEDARNLLGYRLLWKRAQ